MNPARSASTGPAGPAVAGEDGMDRARAAPAGPAAFATRAGDYAQLSRQVRAAGLLGRRRGHYLLRAGLTVSLWAAGWVVFALVGSSWWQLLVAGFLAVVFAQIGFLGHDAGHRQIFRSRRANDRLGLLCANGLIGLSYGWWVDKHNRHHAHPNKTGSDPDIAGAGIAFTPAQAEARHSGLGRWIARHQAGLFFPMLLLEGLDLHFASARALCQRRAVRTRAWWVESVLLVGHLGGYLAAVFWVLPVGQAVAFVAVHQGLLGVYLGCSFAPGHKGMPQLAAGEDLDFLRRQVLTSRNITGGRWLELAMGGLNFQIEHHLFPSMPSPSLHRARPLVRAFCAAHELPYQEATLTGSYAQVLRYLHRVGAVAGPRDTAPRGGR
jgi:fatty acid desaturase